MNVKLTKTFLASLGVMAVGMPISASATHAEKVSAVMVSQQASCSGVVKDAAGEPIIGASVVVKGTTNGAITDFDGNFKLNNVRVGDILQISYIGYVTQEVKYNGRPLSVVMVEDSKVLDDVVVTALGIKRSEKALSYNVQQVNNDKITAVKDANFMNSLTGKVAGVTINSSSAGAGAAARVIMRGTKSLTKDNNALYVIDGIPMFNTVTGGDGGTFSHQPGTSNAADINPEDIESMSILTGPSAAALYGSAAANGVVLITTKQGKAGKAKITYSNSTQFTRPFKMPKFQNRYGNNEGELGSWGALQSTDNAMDPKDFFNTGVNEINSLTLSTGTEQNQTYVSVSATNATGMIPTNRYNRYNFTVRNTSKFANDKLTLDVGAQYIIQDNKNMVGSGRYYNPLVALYLFPRGEDFSEVQMYERYSTARNIMTQYWPNALFGTELDMQNPYWLLHRMPTKMSKNRYMFNASLKWDITPWINVTGRVRVDNSNNDTERKYYASTNPTFTEGSTKGYYSHGKSNDKTFYGDVIVNFNKNFIEDRLNVTANAGVSIDDKRSDATSLGGGLSNIPNHFHYGNLNMTTTRPGESYWHEQDQAIFASAELGWDRQLYLTLTGRNEWSSKLAYTDNMSFFYPSVGLSWVASETFQLPKFINYLKVRGSYAQVGQAPDRYQTVEQYYYDAQSNSYKLSNTRFNPNLKPEDTKSWELGVNARFLDSRINFDLTLYRSNTYNQVFKVESSASSGYTHENIQAGNIQNQGIELALGYNDTFGKVKVSTNLTYTLNQSKVKELANGATTSDGRVISGMEYLSMGSLGGESGPVIRLTEGGTMGDIYINQRLRQSPNGYIWKDTNGNVELEQTEYRKIGSILPKYNLGWNGNVEWNNFNFGFAFAARVGGTVVSHTQAYLDRYGVSEATAAARDAGGVLVGDTYVNAQNYYETISSAIGTYYTYSATNVRLSELSLSYQMPRKWFNNKLDLTLGVTAKNLWMLYCKAPFDPESTASVSSNFNQGVDYFQQPSQRSLGFNVKVSF